MTLSIEKEKLKKYAVKWNGQVGKTYIFYLRRNKQCVRTYAIPNQPMTEPQRQTIEKFRSAVQAWHNLTQEQKQFYNNEVKRKQLKMEGFNYFIRLYMKNQV